MNKDMNTSISRGPLNHEIRDQIIEAATQHFGHYGYEKTTVSDLAKAIGFSKAYIYKFFDSKQAIGSVICANRLAMIIAIVEASISQAPSASEKLRQLFRSISIAGSDLFFHDRKLYDIAAVASRDEWPSVKAHGLHIRKLIQHIVLAGRESGEFERKTPLDETVNAIFIVLHPYINSAQLQYNLDTVPEAIVHLPALILRSLAP